METNVNEPAALPPQLYERVLEIVAETLSLPQDQIVPETCLADHGDSLDAVDIIMELEDEFELRIPDEDAQGLLTVGQIADYVWGHLSSRETESAEIKVSTESGGCA